MVGLYRVGWSSEGGQRTANCSEELDGHAPSGATPDGFNHRDVGRDDSVAILQFLAVGGAQAISCLLAHQNAQFAGLAVLHLHHVAAHLGHLKVRDVDDGAASFSHLLNKACSLGWVRDRIEAADHVLVQQGKHDVRVVDRSLGNWVDPVDGD